MKLIELRRKMNKVQDIVEKRLGGKFLKDRGKSGLNIREIREKNRLGRR